MWWHTRLHTAGQVRLVRARQAAEGSRLLQHLAGLRALFVKVLLRTVSLLLLLLCACRQPCDQRELGALLAERGLDCLLGAQDCGAAAGASCSRSYQ